MSEYEMIERIDMLKESEAIMRAERQALEKKVRDMICGHLLKR